MTIRSKILQITQNTPEWLEYRRKCITASDIPKIVAFLNEETYFGNSHHDWFKEKMGEEVKFTDYKKRLMKNGQLCEEAIVSKHFSDKNKFSHGDVYISGCESFLVSLDVHSKIKNAIIEIKSTEHRSVYEKYKDFSHASFYQLAFQMYITGIDTGFILARLLGDQENESANRITRESKYYKWIEENIEILREIQECLSRKKNYFDKKKEEIEIDDDVQKLAVSINELKKEIKEKSDMLTTWSDEFKEMMRGKESVFAEIDGEMFEYKIMTQSRRNKKLKKEYKEEDVYDIDIKTIEIVKRNKV